MCMVLFYHVYEQAVSTRRLFVKVEGRLKEGACLVVAGFFCVSKLELCKPS